MFQSCKHLSSYKAHKNGLGLWNWRQFNKMDEYNPCLQRRVFPCWLTHTVWCFITKYFHKMAVGSHPSMQMHCRGMACFGTIIIASEQIVSVIGFIVSMSLLFNPVPSGFPLVFKCVNLISGRINRPVATHTA